MNKCFSLIIFITALSGCARSNDLLKIVTYEGDRNIGEKSVIWLSYSNMRTIDFIERVDQKKVTIIKPRLYINTCQICSRHEWFDIEVAPGKYRISVNYSSRTKGPGYATYTVKTLKSKNPIIITIDAKASHYYGIQKKVSSDEKSWNVDVWSRPIIDRVDWFDSKAEVRL